MERLPELLAPAGTPEALVAAIRGGADAVYFGVSGFNARANARNFSIEEMRRGVYCAHTLGVKTYVTLNTMLFDREYSLMLKTAEQIYKSGADAVIVADHGAAELIAKYIPELELHASTQCSAHNSLAAAELAAIGYKRIVPARELSLENIKLFTAAAQKLGVQTEIFIHGALCVSHSGQCLFSSLVGGRSGNRGECAQPCRMPYSLCAARGNDASLIEEGYPLSLKDLSLSKHMDEVIASGVHSLKIEGRMKSPHYVEGVCRIYRRLLDEGRGSTDEEEAALRALFSRDGFTDGYFISGAKSVSLSGSAMTGVRGESAPQKKGKLDQRSGKDPRSQKQAQLDTLSATTVTSADTESLLKPEGIAERKRKITMRASFPKGRESRLTLSLATADGTELRVSVNGEAAEPSKNAPLSRERIAASLCKLGATPFFADAEGVDIEFPDGEDIFLAASALNDLRRRAVSALIDGITAADRERDSFVLPEIGQSARRVTGTRLPSVRSAQFLSADSITPSAAEYFDIIALPLSFFEKNGGRAIPNGVNCISLPPVITDVELQAARDAIRSARECGITHAFVGNVGALALAKEAGLRICLDHRFNIGSPQSLGATRALESLRDEAPLVTVLSAELRQAQIRDICKSPEAEGGGVSAVVYGRIPLMLLERCILRRGGGEVKDCSFCEGRKLYLADRTGEKFPVVREWRHRNLLLNCKRTYMADKQAELDGIGLGCRHFIFTDESAVEVDRIIRAYKSSLSPAEADLGDIRRVR